MDIGGDLLTWCKGDLSLPGLETPGKESELAGEAGFFGDVRIPVTCVSFLGVARAGASQISTSSQLSDSSNEMTFSDLLWFCRTEMSCGTSIAGVALLSDLSREDVPSPRSDGLDSGGTAFLGVSTLVDCPGFSEESEMEVVGVSEPLDRSWGAFTVDFFVSGCSAGGVLAFLFPRRRLEKEGFLTESDVFCSLLLDVPGVLRA